MFLLAKSNVWIKSREYSFPMTLYSNASLLLLFLDLQTLGK